VGKKNYLLSTYNRLSVILLLWRFTLGRKNCLADLFILIGIYLHYKNNKMEWKMLFSPLNHKLLQVLYENKGQMHIKAFWILRT
jgi:hypothetical protein